MGVFPGRSFTCIYSLFVCHYISSYKTTTVSALGGRSPDYDSEWEHFADRRMQPFLSSVTVLAAFHHFSLLKSPFLLLLVTFELHLDDRSIVARVVSPSLSARRWTFCSSWAACRRSIISSLFFSGSSLALRTLAEVDIFSLSPGRSLGYMIILEVMSRAADRTRSGRSLVSLLSRVVLSSRNLRSFSAVLPKRENSLTGCFHTPRYDNSSGGSKGL